MFESTGSVPSTDGTAWASDPEAWWPDKSDVGGFAARMAVDACTVCPARAARLAYALAAHEREGIWGGLLPAERAGLAQSRTNARKVAEWRGRQSA